MGNLIHENAYLVREEVAVKMLHVSTHNLFEFQDERDFRRQTLLGIIEHVFRVAREFDLEAVGATTAEAAAAYRETVPLPASVTARALDRRGHEKNDE